MSKASINKLGRGFDRLASIYDCLLNLSFAGAVNKSQRIFLLTDYKPKTILVLGGGTGKLLIELKKAYPNAQISWCDISAKMIERTKRRCPDLNNVEFVNGTILDVPEQQFDMICTMYVLDCFKQDELNQLLITLDRFSHRDSYLLMADFAIPETHKFYALICRIMVFIMYLFFYLSTGLSVWRLSNFKDLLAAHGLNCINSKNYLGGFIYAGVYRFRHLHLHQD